MVKTAKKKLKSSKILEKLKYQPDHEDSVDEILQNEDDEVSDDEDVTDVLENLKLDNQVGAKKSVTTGQQPKGEQSRSDPESTIFVGNLPTTTKLKQLVKHFTPYGEIVSVRFRSETGKKVLNKTDRKKNNSINAYVAFKTPDIAKKAADEQNGAVFKENHIRVNLVTEKEKNFDEKLNSKSTIFVGNVVFEATDEDLRTYFTETVGEIEYVRRIPKKGIAFICFKKSVQIVKALKMTGADFQGRPLRIQKWVSKDTLGKKEKKDKTVNKKTGKQLDTTRPSNNPLLKKIKDKTKQDNTVDKSEFRKKFREKFSGKHEEKKKKTAYHGVKSDTAGRSKSKKKKALAQKKVKKIAKILSSTAKQ